MNAILNINVRVAAQQANAALRSIQGGVTGVNRAAQAGGMAGFMKHLDPHRMSSFGKNLQWTGQQLSMNFTLPLLAAAGAATKFQLDNEKAMVGVRKVYGDGTESAAQMKREVDALGQSFAILSSRFGVNQAEVIEIGAAWAQAGSAGAGLARSVRTTLQTMILGEMDATTATEGLIAIQSAYRLSSEQLTNVIAGLNSVENQTGINLEGLIQVISRAGGTAKTAGVSIRELSAYAATLVPAAGSAAQAGNALRTILSRIMAPTKETADLLRLMGIEVTSVAWQSQDATGRVDMLAKAFVGLDDAQKTVVSSAAASRWQLNRFDLLMEAVANNLGFYKRAMEVGGDATQDFTEANARTAKVMNDELLAALQSNPQQLQILLNVLKNTLSQGIQPLIPHIVFMAQQFVQLTQAFMDMDPTTQRLITTFLVILALLGPITKYVGAFTLLFGTAGSAIKWVIGLLFGHVGAVTTSTVAVNGHTTATTVNTVAMARQGGVLRTVLIPMVRLAAGAFLDMAAKVIWAMAGVFDAIVAGTLPLWGWVAIIAAVLAAIALAIHTFYDGGIRGFIQDVGRAFGALPGIVADAFNGVIRVLAHAIEIVQDFLSYLNPFARHSPSLVDNVEAGIGVILAQYSRLRAIPGIMSSAISALNRFNEAAAGGRSRFQDAEYAEQRQDIGAIAPEALPAADELYEALRTLRPELVAIGNELSSQTLVVDQWKAKLDLANSALDAADLKLDALKSTAEQAKDALDLANTELDRLRDIKLDGWYAMQDAIFENEMAQKALRLEILKLEDAGMSVDDLNDKLNKLRGEIEMLQSEAGDLRLAGAGSDITGPIQEQIDALKDMEQSTMAAGSPINKLQEELEALQRAGEIMDLEGSLHFDPLQRELDNIGKTLEELPFAELSSQITAQQGVVDELTKAWAEADAAAQMQQVAVDRLRMTRDEIATSYDAEKATLDALKDAYGAVEQQIRDMESALNEFASSAKKARDDLSMAEELFMAGEGFNFDDIGGNSDIGREGGLADIEAFNKEMEAQLAEAMGNMGKSFDVLAPIKEGIEKAKVWLQQNAARVLSSAILFALTALGLIIFTAAGGWVIMLVAGLVAALNMAFGGAIVNALQAAWKWVTDAFLPWVADSLAPIGDFFVAIFETLGDALAATWDFIEPILGAIGDAFVALGDGIGAIFGAIADIVSWWWNNITLPVFRALIGFVNSYILPIFQLIGAVFRIAFEVMANIVGWWWNNVTLPVFRAVVGFIRDYIIPIVQVVQGVFEVAIGAIVAVIHWLGDAIGWVWHNVVSPVFSWIGNHITTVAGAIAGTVGWMVDTVLNLFNWVAGWVYSNFGPVFSWLAETIQNVMGRVGSIVGEVWRGAVNGIIRGLNFVIDAFNAVVRTVKRAGNFFNVDINVNEMPRIGLMHTGGPVTGPFGGMPGLRSDETVKVLQRGEYVLSAAAVRDLRAAATGAGGDSFRSGQALVNADSAGGGGVLTMERTENRTEITFTGDLSFPNITSPEDAEEFVDNLLRLASG